MKELLLGRVPDLVPAGRLIFSLDNFATTTSIKDTGPFDISLLKGSALKTGVDENGEYILFDGTTNSFISFSDPRLDFENVLIRIVFAITDTRARQNYSVCLLDTRPDRQNGNYIGLAYYGSVTSKLELTFALPSTVGYFHPDALSRNQKHQLDFLIDTRDAKGYVDKKQIEQINTSFPMTNQQYKIGKSAYAPTVPSFIGKLYKFEIYEM